MKRVHVSTIAKWDPCIDPLTIVSNDWEGTALDVLALDNIKASDKLWVVLRPEFLSDKTLRLFAVACARSFEHLLTDERSKKAIDVAERYAHGQASALELEAAWAAAADAAARSAVWAAARATAWSATDAAARSAVWAAAWAAAREAAVAAWSAAREAAVARAVEAAWSAEAVAARAAAEAKVTREKQVEMLIELIKKHEVET